MCCPDCHASYPGCSSSGCWPRISVGVHPACRLQRCLQLYWDLCQSPIDSTVSNTSLSTNPERGRPRAPLPCNLVYHCGSLLRWKISMSSKSYQSFTSHSENNLITREEMMQRNIRTHRHLSVDTVDRHRRHGVVIGISHGCISLRHRVGSGTRSHLDLSEAHWAQVWWVK